MRHYGDITKIRGDAVETVDIITGGSPCQDLSVAGKRAGLDGERSGLFMEQIRIVKEMRDHDVRTNGRTGQFIRPRYMVWENVPGAFSSKGGKDFQAVLTEIVRIVEPDCPDVPMPEKGRWAKSGCLHGMGGRWSVAWRVHDAQFWGVPQRRKRIALVADFGGMSAPEILFERKGLSGDFEQGEQTRESVAGTTSDCAGTAIPIEGNGARESHKGYGWGESDVMFTLNGTEHHAVCTNGDIAVVHDGHNYEPFGDVCKTVLAAYGTGDNNTPLVVQPGSSSAIALDARENGDGKTVPTITGDHENRITDYTAILLMDVYQHHGYRSETVGTLTRDQNVGIRGDTPLVVSEKHSAECFQNTGHGYLKESEIGATVRTPAGGGSMEANLCNTNNAVRRLTPLECERLQGFPDHWTFIGDWTDSKGKTHKCADSPRYKALGNSIALPFWAWLARRICAQYERPMTMASLFDGIAGFPLVFSRAGCTPVWASEIEEFPIAVTKVRFPE